MVDPAVAVNITVFLSLVTLGLALIMSVVSLLSWSRLRDARVLAVSGGFVILTLKGAWSSFVAVTDREPALLTAGLDMLVLAFFYVSVAKR